MCLLMISLSDWLIKMFVFSIYHYHSESKFTKVETLLSKCSIGNYQMKNSAVVYFGQANRCFTCSLVFAGQNHLFGVFTFFESQIIKNKKRKKKVKNTQKRGLPSMLALMTMVSFTMLCEHESPHILGLWKVLTSLGRITS